MIVKTALKIKREMICLNTWFERDRAHIEIFPTDNLGERCGDTILEFWDKEVREIIEDGFVDPKDTLNSMIDYGEYLGLIELISEETCDHCFIEVSGKWVCETCEYEEEI